MLNGYQFADVVELVYTPDLKSGGPRPCGFKSRRPHQEEILVGHRVMDFSKPAVTLSRCPHCSVANGQFLKKWVSDGVLPRADLGPRSFWAAFACSACEHLVAIKGPDDPTSHNRFDVEAIYPKIREADAAIDAVPRKFLQQAYDTLHAPDAAAVMAGSAVDAML